MKKKAVQTNREVEEQAKLALLEDENVVLKQNLAESVQREKDAAQENLGLSDQLLAAQRNLDGYGKEKTASIIIKPGERPLIELTGWWAARDWSGLHRQFLETVRRQKPIEVVVKPTEDELAHLSETKPSVLELELNNRENL